MPETLTITCIRCNDTGWVCEADNLRPWGGVTRRGCKCSGCAGAPCPNCNIPYGNEPPRMPPETRIAADKDGMETLTMPAMTKATRYQVAKALADYDNAVVHAGNVQLTEDARVAMISNAGRNLRNTLKYLLDVMK